MSTSSLKFVDHPRYGRFPAITGLNPEGDYFANGIHLHWHSPPGVRIPNTAIVADTSRQAPATLPVTHYFDAKRTCVDCGQLFIFFAAEQKYWYEELHFPLESDCVRCVPCRRNQRDLDFQKYRYEELFHLQARTLKQNIEFAESALSLVEGGVFGVRVLDRVRRILKTGGSAEALSSLWQRVRALEGVD